MKRGRPTRSNLAIKWHGKESSKRAVLTHYRKRKAAVVQDHSSAFKRLALLDHHITFGVRSPNLIIVSLCQETGEWCSKNTIINWLKSQPDFCLYTKRIRPGLTEQNRMKQISFSRHVHNRWGLAGDTRILWTMSDEKWWFGLVSRTFAKMCPALGIAKEVFAVHHKKHISKVN